MLLEGRKGIQECLDGGMKVARKFGKIEIFWLAWFAHAGVFRICKRFARKRKALRVILLDVRSVLERAPRELRQLVGTPDGNGWKNEFHLPASYASIFTHES